MITSQAGYDPRGITVDDRLSPAGPIKFIKENIKLSYLDTFRMPKPMKITGRSSSITNSFINSIIPVIHPTEDQVKKALETLEMTPKTFQCSYCGDKASEWDHLRPLVKDQRPTGFVSEIHNLVPSCGKCNQSKGNKPWRIWIESDAVLSPKSRGITNLQHRIERLSAFEQWSSPTKLDFESIVGPELWDQHWQNWDLVQESMKIAQKIASEINDKIASSFNSK